MTENSIAVNEMFCFQCQETAKGIACTIKGVCGKSSSTSAAMDLLLFVVRGVCSVADILRENGIKTNHEVNTFVTDALFSTITNANFDDESILKRVDRGLELKTKLKNIAEKENIKLPAVDEIIWNTENRKFYDEKSRTVGILREKNEDIRSLKELIIYGLKGMAAYHEHAMRFLREADASMVAVNASTRFNDGGQLGLGAEIGISTSKLHAYGPMGVQELTTTKFVVFGQGQVRQ